MVIPSPLISAGTFADSREVTLELYDSTVVETRGVPAALPQSPGEAVSPWATAGPCVFFSYLGDPEQIEFVSYVDPRTETGIRRRAIYAERQSSPLQPDQCFAALQAP